MAAYLNRTISLMTGNGTEPSSPSHDNANALLDRSLHNNTAYENSPLQIFVKAKKKINDIFGEIEEYVVETARFMDGKWATLHNFLYIRADAIWLTSIPLTHSRSIVGHVDRGQSRIGAVSQLCAEGGRHSASIKSRSHEGGILWSNVEWQKFRHKCYAPRPHSAIGHRSYDELLLPGGGCRWQRSLFSQRRFRWKTQCHGMYPFDSTRLDSRNDVSMGFCFSLPLCRISNSWRTHCARRNWAKVRKFEFSGHANAAVCYATMWSSLTRPALMCHQIWTIGSIIIVWMLMFLCWSWMPNRQWLWR